MKNKRREKRKGKLPTLIVPYVARHKWAYLGGILTLFIVDYVNLYIPQFTGDITDGLEMGTLDLPGILELVAYILLCGLVLMTGRFFWRYFIFGACRKIEFEIRKDLFSHLSGLSMNYYNHNKTGDLMAHFTNDLNAIRMSVGPAVVTTFDAIIMTVMVLIKMVVHVNLKLTLIAVIPMLFILLGGIYYGNVIERRYEEKQKAFSDMTDQVQESISGIRVIKAFVQERQELKAFAKANKNNKDKNMRVVRLQAFVMPLLDVMIGLASVITLLYGGYLVVNKQITTGQFVAFNQYIGMLVWPMLATGESITYFSQGAASMKRVQSIFEEEAEIRDTEKTDERITSLDGEISIRHLSFRYKEALPEALSDISVEVKKGETLAILGRTGSGKTTLANLLLHLYNTEDGMIFFDGRDINEIPLHVLREQIAYVPQDNFLFSDTLQTNIAFGKRTYRELPKNNRLNKKLILNHRESMEAILEKELMARESVADKLYDDLPEVKEAAKAACIHDNIMEFPKQYSTMVGERGVTISGGQKQRSSIARALMKDAPILILDDSLSAVDTDTEEQILHHLKQNRKDRTTIIIAHRISTIQNADHILVLEEGKMAEYGTHTELLKLDGIYARLYEKQQLEAQLETAAGAEGLGTEGRMQNEE
ncbi:MAG: ABC transporter ATP-binding protein [Lachnospiraceae bacterium]